MMNNVVSELRTQHLDTRYMFRLVETEQYRKSVRGLTMAVTVYTENVADGILQQLKDIHNEQRK